MSLASPAPHRLSPPKRNRKVRHILVIQTAFIGDVILTTPLLRQIGEIFPDASLDVLVNPIPADLLAGNPHIRHVITYDKRSSEKGPVQFLKLARRLRQARYDAVLLPHRSVRSALLAYLAGSPLRIGFNTSPGSFLYTDIVPYLPGVHETERYLSLLSIFLTDPADKTPWISIDEDQRHKAVDFLRGHGLTERSLIVGLAPGSVWPTKRWLPEGFAAVADRLITEKGAGVILFGGPRDQALCSHIESLMHHRPVLAAGIFTLRESAALMTHCRVFLSNDTGLMHLAAAMRVPVVAIFGPTMPGFGFTPVGEHHTIIERKIPCRPCGAHGGKQCREKTFACMRTVSHEEVYAALLPSLSTSLKMNTWK